MSLFIIINLLFSSIYITYTDKYRWLVIGLFSKRFHWYRNRPSQLGKLLISKGLEKGHYIKWLWYICCRTQVYLYTNTVGMERRLNTFLLTVISLRMVNEAIIRDTYLGCSPINFNFLLSQSKVK